MRGHVAAALALVLFIPGLGVVAVLVTPITPCVFAGAEPLQGEAGGLVLCTAPVREGTPLAASGGIDVQPGHDAPVLDLCPAPCRRDLSVGEAVGFLPRNGSSSSFNTNTTTFSPVLSVSLCLCLCLSLAVCLSLSLQACRIFKKHCPMCTRSTAKRGRRLGRTRFSRMGLASASRSTFITGGHGIQLKCGCKRGHCNTKSCKCFKAGKPCSSSCHGNNGSGCCKNG